MASFQKVQGEMRDKEIRKPGRKGASKIVRCREVEGADSQWKHTDGEGPRGTGKLEMPGVVFEDSVLISKCFPSPGFPGYRKFCGTHRA